MSRIAKSGIQQELASLMAEAEQKKRLFLAGLNASKTVLFHGVDDRPLCSVRERQELRRHTRQVLHKLLDMGITTILVEDSSLYGYYALEELLRQRRKHHFSLYVFHRENYPYRWLHTNESKLSHIRSRKNIHYMIQCDGVLGTLNEEEWLNLFHKHIALAISEKSPYYRNWNALTEEQYNQWGNPLGEAEAAELIRWLVCGDEQV